MSKPEANTKEPELDEQQLMMSLLNQYGVPVAAQEGMLRTP